MRTRSVAAIVVFGGVALAMGRVSTPQSHSYPLGTVTVVIPPPAGFEDSEVLLRRMPADERLVNLAAHLPADIAKTFTADQDAAFYTKVSVSRKAVSVDISDELFRDAQRQMGGSAPYDDAAVKKYMTDLASQRNLTFDQPVALGTFDRTDRSLSTLALMSMTSGNRRFNVLFTSSILHLRRRMIFVYAFRVIGNQADQPLVEKFTREWVRSILAANP